MNKLIGACLATLLLLSTAGPAGAASALPSANVAWQPAAADADIDRAFAQARAEGKPVLLYWGATWCPPCNQLKFTVFNRQEFAALAKHFIAVHVDGDRPGAQRLGRRFKVSGYPTTVLFTPSGQEITRLPGEVDAAQALALLQLGLAGGRPAGSVLGDAVAGQPLTAGEWRLLAFYSWDTDEQQLAPKAELPGLLARLAASAQAHGVADAETVTRLWLKALAAHDEGHALEPEPELRERVLAVLADPVQARLQMDLLTSGAGDIVRALAAAGSPARAPLVAAFDTALQRLAADSTLSRADRLAAVDARVELARLNLPKDALRVALAAALLDELRDLAARADREITDAYERQAVITEAAGTLADAGLWDESDALLKANLGRSHSPYYLMSQLAGNARKLGHKDQALRWYGRAWRESEGPATRLQWGAAYLGALIELAPQDSRRIEATAAQLLAEAARDGAAFEGRSARSLQKAGAALVGWNADGRKSGPLRRLQARLDGLCAKVDAADGQYAACRALLKTPAKKAA